MLLMDNLVEMKWSHTNRKRYEALGYQWTNLGDLFYAKAQDVLICSSGAKIPVMCDYCGETYYPTSRNYQKAHLKKPQDCCVRCKGKEIRDTVRAKYGVDNVVYLSECRKKMEETCLERYGTVTPLHNPNIFKKTQQSLNEHYGISDGIKSIRSVHDVHERILATMEQRYGGKAPACSFEIREKIIGTMAANGNCPTSAPQIALCEMIKGIYGNCELNYICDRVCLDCMTIVDGVKIDVEYDGWYWHKDKQDKDLRRDFFVESCGYKVVRFIAYENRVPTIKELTDAITKLTTTDRKITRVNLNKI